MKRKLFNAALFAAVVVAAPVSTFVSCADYDSDIENLNTQVKDLKDLVEQKEQALQTKIAALEAQDKALEDAYKAADAALKQSVEDLDVKLSAEIAACKAECAAAREQLKQQIAETNADLAKLSEKHDTDVAALLQADVVLQQNIDAVNNLVADLNTRFTALEGRVAANEGNIAALQTELQRVNADLAKVREEFAAADAALKSELQGKIDELWAQVNANKTAIQNEVSAREAAVNALQDVVEANKTAVDQAVAELKNKDAELAGQVQALTNDFNSYKELTNAEVDKLKASVAAVEGKVSDNTAAILSLTERVADLYNGLDKLNAALEAAVAAQETVDAAQDLKINDALLRVGKAEGRLDGAEGRLDDVEGNIAELGETVSGILGNLVNLTGQVDLNTENIEIILEQLNGVKNDIKTMKDDIEAVQSDIDNLYGTTDRLQGQINNVIAQYIAADEALEAKLNQKIEDLETNLTNLIETYAKELSSEVKGFVLNPDSYYEGIQAIEGDVYKYKTWVIGTDGFAKHDGKSVEFCPDVVATYHVNPSNAVLSTDVKYYHYNVEDRINRGNNTALNPVIKSVEQQKITKADMGMNNTLAVRMSLTDPTANKTPEHLHIDRNTPVTVMALQYVNPAAKATDPVVTSDYAVLYLNTVCSVDLLFEDGKDVPDLHSHWTLALPPYLTPAKEILVNYKDTYEIEKHIKTQFGEKAASATLPEGFKYRYTFVQGDKKYFNATELEAGVVNPVLPNGQEEANATCIGKNITVRVDVVNGENVAEVGFFKFTIVGDVTPYYADNEITTDNYYVSCDDAANALQATLSAEKVWKKIKDVSGCSDEQWAQLKGEYTWVYADEAHSVLQQYQNPRQPRETEPKGGIGTVVLNENGSLTWTITYGELKAANAAPTLVTAVLVRSKVLDNVNGYNEFYLPLVWEPAETEVWGDEDGVEAVVWEHKDITNEWQPTPLKGYELRLYADLTQKGSTPFVYNIREKAMTEMSTRLVNADKFKNVANGDIKLTDGRFIFVDHPIEDARHAVGTKYNLFVSEDGTELRACIGKSGYSEVIAKISAKGVVELVPGEYTKDILNRYEKDQLHYGETLAAHVSYEVKCCAGKVKVVNGDFDVRFLKPITMKTYSQDIYDTDGLGGVIDIHFTKNLICFNGVDFKDHPEYNDIFNVNFEIGQPATWHTNYNGEDIENGKTLGEYPAAAKCFSTEIDNNNNEYVRYTNNTSVVSDYTVRVPVLLHYTWGDTPYYFDVNVKRTMGNSNKR